jgi:acetolactate synthase small subunit
VRETALVKIHATEPRRDEIKAVAEGFGARIIAGGPQSVVVEMTDTPARLGEMIARAMVFGTCETMRSGSLAMALGAAIPREQATPDDKGRPWWSQADGVS